MGVGAVTAAVVNYCGLLLLLGTAALLQRNYRTDISTLVFLRAPLAGCFAEL